MAAIRAAGRGFREIAILLTGNGNHNGPVFFVAYIPDDAIDRMSELSAGAWRLYCFLARCRNQKSGKCCPSVRTSAEAINVHPKNIFKLRKELVSAGWAQFQGDAALYMLGFESSKNATPDVAAIAFTAIGSKNATDEDLSSKNATTNVANIEDVALLDEGGKSATQADESQKRYPMVAKTLPDGSKNATAYKEEPAKEPAKGTSKDIPASPSDSPPAEKGSAKKKSQPPKSVFHNHPAVVAYRQVLGFNAVNAAQADLIAQATGPQAEAAPADWLKFLRELAESGNKHVHNVRVMVWAFERYETGACLAESLDVAWGREKGRPAAVNGALNAFSPAAQKTIAAADEWLKQTDGRETR